VSLQVREFWNFIASLFPKQERLVSCSVRNFGVLLHRYPKHKRGWWAARLVSR